MYDKILETTERCVPINNGYEVMPPDLIFRFDDVCINADMELINSITDYLFEKFPGCVVVWGVSPLVHDNVGERVFPKIYGAYSDYKWFYNVDRLGIPPLRKDVEIASHGLIHVDGRLLTKEQQEMSILISCSLLKSKIYIPPFNKYNEDTKRICEEAGIELIAFEDGWLSMEHNKFDENKRLWYLHARDWTLDKIKLWFEK